MDRQLYFCSELKQYCEGKSKISIKMRFSYSNKTRNWRDLTMSRLNLMR